MTTDLDKLMSPWGFASTSDPETWHHGGRSREEAIAAGRDFYEGATFWIVEGKYGTSDDYAQFAAEAAIDSIREQADNDAGEAAEDYGPTTEAAKELDTLIREWARRHMIPTFWSSVGTPEEIQDEG